MKFPKKRALLVAFAVAIIVGFSSILYSWHLVTQQQLINGYEDKNGWIYQCMPSIKGKYSDSQTHGPPQSLVPSDPAEAAKYCHKVGIE